MNIPDDITPEEKELLQDLMDHPEIFVLKDGMVSLTDPKGIKTIIQNAVLDDLHQHYCLGGRHEYN